jgi:DNA-binding transcriptional LysR family regulator
MKFRSLLSDHEAELLIAFESNPGIEALAQALGRDPTVISKQLKRIAANVPALRKVGGRWQLTEQGKKLNQLTREYVIAQSAVTQLRPSIRVGANREFGTRVLSRDIQKFLKAMAPSSISIKLYEAGIENALLDGQIDLGFDCGKPYSPEIAYRSIAPEPILPVISPKLLKTLRINVKEIDFSAIPHIYCDRLKPDRITGEEYALNIQVSTNDIGAAREMCVQRVGWAMLPQYTMQLELENQSLVPLGNKIYSDEEYGVWYLRGSTRFEILYFNTR